MTFGDVCHRFQTNMESISSTHMLIYMLLEKTSTYLTAMAQLSSGCAFWK